MSESIETRLRDLGIVLPAPLKTPPRVRLPFSSVRVRGNRACVSGHLPLNPDGSVAEPLGKIGKDLSLEQGAHAARLVGLAMLGSLQRELGSLDRITAWLRVFGMANMAPGFTQTSVVINGFSELLLEVFGPEKGAHARSAIGVAELPFNAPVEIEAEVEIG
ncbi:MAG TPA: RidA family protein [Thermoanaerobaculia bacterium]|jgi:enamine deaminase RidA (YjgF/YER057c/UK114 family)|nr:RidA family protein [Thermoanaerobaculia bacterium]